MQAVILGAGKGSRLESYTDELPKPFVSVGGKPILQWQLNALSEICETVTLVLGYGFTGQRTPESVLEEQISVPESIELETIVLQDWAEYENAWSCHEALRSNSVRNDIHTLLVCGDVLFGETLVENFVNDFETKLNQSCSYVVTIEGVQDEMTAIRWEEDGYVTAYGAIEGHQEAGLFLLNADHVDIAIEILDGRFDDWFPIVFPEVESKPYLIEGDDHVEVNTPAHLAEARETVPFGEADITLNK